MIGVRFVLPYPPTANTLYVNRRGGGKALTGDHTQFRARVRIALYDQAMRAGLTMSLIETPISITIDAYRPRKVGDLDNITKTLLDGLNGILWRDDSQIVRIIASRYDDKVRPRVEVVVTEARPE